MFMMKNVLEVLLAFVFITMNVIVGTQSQDTTELCEIQMLDRKTVVVMQCRQKRYDVFIALLQLLTFTLVLHALVNLCSVCWGLPRYFGIWYLCAEIHSISLSLPSTGLRQISGIMRELQEAIKTSRPSKASMKRDKKKRDTTVTYDIEHGVKLSLVADNTACAGELAGADFLFLFDLIACTCGKAATLRVLSYTSPSFEQLCQPRILCQRIAKTETSIKITWTSTPLQNILPGHDKLAVAEYVATIFPGQYWKTLSEKCREVEFNNLCGGTTEYTITVSAIVGNAKMKGVATKQFLPPFPPQNLTAHPSEVQETTQRAMV
jgi:hypothetical protein